MSPTSSQQIDQAWIDFILKWWEMIRLDTIYICKMFIQSMCTIFNAVIMSLFLPAVYPHSWTTQQGLELSHRARLEHDDEDDECVDLGGWQVEPRIVRIASIRLGESNSSTALGLESEFCDKPGNSYFCGDCSANKVNNTVGKRTKVVVGFVFVS